MSKIKVYNESGMKVDVAINHWGPDGSTDFFTIDSNKSENWERSDNRGFIMVITQYKDDRKKGIYWYVKADKELTIKSLTEVVGAIQKLKNPFQ